MEYVYITALLQGFLGGSDTFYYHEYRCKLPSQPSARKEQLLHGIRNALYATLYLQLGLGQVRGWWVVPIATILLAEIVITMLDFVEEDRTRRLFAGERVMHGVIAILFGVFLAQYVPILWSQFFFPTEFVLGWHDFSWLFVMMSVGAYVMTLRDLMAYRRLGVR